MLVGPSGHFIQEVLIESLALTSRAGGLAAEGQDGLLVTLDAIRAFLGDGLLLQEDECGHELVGLVGARLGTAVCLS